MRQRVALSVVQLVSLSLVGCDAAQDAGVQVDAGVAGDGGVQADSSVGIDSRTSDAETTDAEATDVIAAPDATTPIDAGFDLACGTLVRISGDQNGDNADDDVEQSIAISQDGRSVAFVSGASDLIPNDLNGTSDVFVRDLFLGATERVSVATNGAEGNAQSGNRTAGGGQVDISADGRYVFFVSEATTLAPGLSPGFAHYFVRDRLLQTTELADVSETGIPANNTIGNYGSAVLSASGRKVVFDSFATNLVPNDTNDHVDTFVRDLDLDTIVRVSVDANGNQLPLGGFFGGIGPDDNTLLSGTYEMLPNGDLSWSWSFLDLTSLTRTPFMLPTSVTCHEIGPMRLELLCGSENALVPEDNVTGVNSYLFDTINETFTLVDADSTGHPLSQLVFYPWADASADFSKIVFTSRGAYAPNDANGSDDVYVRDRTTQTLRVISVGLNGFPAGFSRDSIISDDGRFIAFYSLARNLTANDDALADIYVVRDCP